MKRTLPILALLLAPLLAQAATTRAQMLMGTTCEITVPDGDARYLNDAFTEGARVEKMLSTWRPDTELSRLNAGALTAPSLELRNLLKTTLEFARITGGAFNPLVRPLIDIWKTRDGGAVPTKEAIAEAVKRVEPGNVQTSGGDIVRLNNGAQFEEGAWGKGYAIDQMLATLRRDGATRVMINFGGQIGQYGDQPFVTIADPEKRDTPAIALTLSKNALSTSSGSTQTFHAGGRTFTHIIDPRSGEALPPRGSVSVIHRSGFDADMLSTALYVMGPDEGLKWARDHDVDAIFITDKNEVLTSKPIPALQVLDAKFTLKR